LSIGRTLKKLLGGVAPTIGTALGGPLGGVAMKFLADRFTDGDTGKVEDYLLSASPDALKDLKTADMEFRKHMADLGVRLEEIASEDRSDARLLAREKGLFIQGLMAMVYTAGYFGTLGVFIMGWVAVPTDYIGMVNTLIGALGAAQLQILNFFFGSSRGSKEKTELLLAGK